MISIQKIIPHASRLIYGCMNMGGSWDSSAITLESIIQAEKIIELCLEHGINYFDHADIYCRGKSEEVFSRALARRPEFKEKMILQSKCSIKLEDPFPFGYYDLSHGWITQSVEGILKRLNIDKIDILLLHRTDLLMKIEEVADTLNKLKNQGKFSHLGVSNMHGYQIELLSKYLNFPIIINQMQMSLEQVGFLEEQILAGRSEGSKHFFSPGLLDYSKLHGIQIQAWESLAKGKFSGSDISGEGTNIHQTKAYVMELSSKYHVSHEAIVLGFLLKHPAGIQPIIGTTNLQRIYNATESLNFELSYEEWYKLFILSRGNRLP